MGIYSFLCIDNRAFYEVKNGYPPGLDILFRSSDARPRTFEKDEPPVDSFEASLDLARLRLNVSGYTLARAEQSYKQWRSVISSPAVETDLFDPSALDQRFYEAHSFDSYTEILLGLLDGDGSDVSPDQERMLYGGGGYLWEFPCEDPLVALSIAIHRIEGRTLSSSLGLMEDGPPWRLEERERLVVLTEGKADAQLLERAFSIVAPKFARELKFLDHDFRPPAGSSEVVNLLKSFAAAGLRTPVVAVFDNDTAGHLAIRQASALPLPGNIVVTTYPNIEIAEQYPTLGPSGHETHDVNGSACSLELYLGADSLTINGELSPVRWTGYQDRLARYQGVVTDKATVQAAFKQKLAASEAKERPIGDWSGIEAILEVLVRATRRLQRD